MCANDTDCGNYNYITETKTQQGGLLAGYQVHFEGLLSWGCLSVVGADRGFLSWGRLVESCCIDADDMLLLLP